jgi:hypothetical protein
VIVAVDRGRHEETIMIMSVAHASVDESEQRHVFGAWSNLIVGSRPEGLVDCYLLETEGAVQIAAIWTSVDDHDRAIHEEANHPAYAVFEASGADPTHSVYKVVGRLG